MSHVAQCSLQIKDLDALKQACKHFGLEFRTGQKTYAWFGDFMNDWNDPRAAAMQGRDPKTFGKCEHALRPTNWRNGDYEIGVVRNSDGTYYLIYDSFGYHGAPLETIAGKDMVKL